MDEKVKESIINAILKKYKAPDESLVPYVFQRRITYKDGSPVKLTLWNNITGKRMVYPNWTNTLFYDLKDDDPLKFNFYRGCCPARDIRGVYLKYYDEYDVLEISWVDGKNKNGNVLGKDGDKIKWQFENTRAFLFKGDGWLCYYDLKRHLPIIYNSINEDETLMNRLIHKDSTAGCYISTQGLQEWGKFYGKMTYANNGMNYASSYEERNNAEIQIKDTWHLFYAYKAYVKELKRKVYESKPHDQHTVTWVAEHTNVIDYANLKELKKGSRIEKVNEDIFLIRVVVDNSISPGYKDWCRTDEETTYEGVRVFVSQKQGTSYALCRSAQTAPWRKNKLDSLYVSNTIPIKHMDMSIGLLDNIKDTTLMDMVKRNASNAIDVLVSLVRYPILERIEKAGYHNITSIMEHVTSTDLKSRCYLDRMFITQDRKHKIPTNIKDIKHYGKNMLKAIDTVCKALGTDYDRRMNNMMNAITAMYYIYGDKLQFMSYENLKEDLMALSHIFEENTMWLSYSNKAYKMYNYNSYDAWHEDADDYITVQEMKELNMVKRVIRHDIERIGNNVMSYVCNLYVDTLNLIERFGQEDREMYRRRLARINVSEDLKTMHDTVVVDYNRQSDSITHSRLEEEMTERYNKEHEKYEASNDKFVIKFPKHEYDIITEGKVLCHCVGGYANSHAHGRTTILFLRHKDTPDFPFYTIEVNNGCLIQIHGAYNKWLGNDPEAIPFVYKWLEDHKIAFNMKILLNKSNGYSNDGEYIDEEIVQKMIQEAS